MRLVAGTALAGTIAMTALSAPATAQERSAAARTAGEVIASSREDEWRPLDPDNTLYVEIGDGLVVVELAPEFAPRHIENIQALVRGGYFDGAAITRSQDNYVVQWGIRALAEGEALSEDIAISLPPEFETSASGLPFARLPDPDPYAPEVGFVRGFPAGRDPDADRAWMTHCYGVVAVPRGNDPSSGSGAGLYVVIGHAPRHLDRNLTVIGRVVSGMERLSTLPRGRGPLGRYESEAQWIYLESVRLGRDLPAAERTEFEVMRTESESFEDLVLASRSRQESFFVHPSDRIGLCNVRVPIRPIGSN
ncbi:MAG: peptidylprolyl isomerase [Gemmatimonadetes bacterium]|nr:peptidylprolyl isomerase [Gemmatimonadota bacterium]